jgi:uncharacterized protein (DUF1330 family)
MSAYLIVEVKEVTDPKKYAEYMARVPAIVERFGGEYLIRGGRSVALAGSWDPKKMVIIRFESMDRVQAWWNSPEYRAVAPLREQSARTEAVVVEGL